MLRKKPPYFIPRLAIEIGLLVLCSSGTAFGSGLSLPIGAEFSAFDLVKSPVGTKVDSSIGGVAGLSLTTPTLFQWNIVQAGVRHSFQILNTASGGLEFSTLTVMSLPAISLPMTSSNSNRNVDLRIFAGGGYSDSFSASFGGSPIPSGTSPVFSVGMEFISSGKSKPSSTFQGLGIKFIRYVHSVPVDSETSIIINGVLSYDLPLLSF